MIQAFIDKYMAGRDTLRAKYAAKVYACTYGHGLDYEELVKDVVALLHDEDEYRSPDPERITRIDHGDYQGTLLFVIGATGYQPDDFWFVKVGYGSCSACDTLQAAETVDEIMTLSLHIVQGIKSMQVEP